MILINRGQDPLATIFYEKWDKKLLKNLIKIYQKIETTFKRITKFSIIFQYNDNILSYSSLGLSNHLIRS